MQATLYNLEPAVVFKPSHPRMCVCVCNYFLLLCVSQLCWVIYAREGGVY
nr:MAG TPA: hypothetical protein [Caudoviricetes sp.]